MCTCVHVYIPFCVFVHVQVVTVIQQVNRIVYALRVWRCAYACVCVMARMHVQVASMQCVLTCTCMVYTHTRVYAPKEGRST